MGVGSWGWGIVQVKHEGEQADDSTRAGLWSNGSYQRSGRRRLAESGLF